MKTFLLSAVKRLKSYSQKLDAKSILYDKSWEVFNENGDKELMIFRTNQELLISRNGIIQKGKWELLDIANIIIDVGEKSYLFNASYIEDNFLALKLDGTEEYMVMIEADMMNRFSLNSVKSIESYLDNRYKKIEDDKAREQKRLEAIQQSKRDKEEALRLEAEREREQEKEKEISRQIKENSPERIREREIEEEKELERKKKNLKKWHRNNILWFVLFLFLTITLAVLNILNFYFYITAKGGDYVVTGLILIPILGGLFLSFLRDTLYYWSEI